ncbi:MAG: sugar phosphate isomerase/epimerase family protein [Chloroflexia bacterium]
MAPALRLLVACQRDDWDHLPVLARLFPLGVEVGDFADPDLLEGDWRARLEELKPLLESLPGLRALHGPRSDLNPGLRDRGLVAFCRERYRRALEVAAALEASVVVFHTGFNPLIRAPGFERRWLQRSADFWQGLGEEAGRLGITLLLENVWEPQPQILRDLVDLVDLPTVRACLDIGHANIYSRYPVGEWVSLLGERVVYVHLHNNDGRMDTHASLEKGTVDYARILPLLVVSPQQPALVLEVSGGKVERQESLFYLRRLLGLG